MCHAGQRPFISLLAWLDKDSQDRIASLAGTRMLDLPAHLSLGCFAPESLAEVQARLASMDRFAPIPVCFTSLGILPPDVLYAAPAASSGLMALARAACGHAPDPGWTPHVTLFTRREKDITEAVHRTVGRFAAFQGWITGVSLYRFWPAEAVGGVLLGTADADGIAPMMEKDYDEAYALWRATPGMGLRRLDDSRQGIAGLLARNPGMSFVARRDGRVVGCILAGHDGRRGFLYHAAVAAEYQGRGLGRALVRRALRALDQEGIPKANLVVFAHNEGGNAFWSHMGFAVRTDIVYRDKILREGNGSEEF